MTEINCLGSTIGDKFALYNGDCVEILRQMPDACIDLSVYSPPFADLFVYSDSERDMGNVADDDEFFGAYRFVISELLRTSAPGRLSVVHCKDLNRLKWRDGYVGLRDFPGRIIQAHIEAGWVYHSRVTVWKDPVTEMQRTKALGLLYKQLKADASRTRVGCPDYLCVFRAPGENTKPITHTEDGMPLERWQRYASPVWFDIDQSRTLNARLAREDHDQRHMCPLQLDVIDRVLDLWSAPDDVVCSPFAGIGSEGVQSILAGRRFVGCELKPAYYELAVQNLRDVDAPKQKSLW